MGGPALGAPVLGTKVSLAGQGHQEVASNSRTYRFGLLAQNSFSATSYLLT